MSYFCSDVACNRNNIGELKYKEAENGNTPVKYYNLKIQYSTWVNVLINTLSQSIMLPWSLIYFTEAETLSSHCLINKLIKCFYILKNTSLHFLITNISVSIQYIMDENWRL